MPVPQHISASESTETCCGHRWRPAIFTHVHRCIETQQTVHTPPTQEGVRYRAPWLHLFCDLDKTRRISTASYEHIVDVVISRDCNGFTLTAVYSVYIRRRVKMPLYARYSSWTLKNSHGLLACFAIKRSLFVSSVNIDLNICICRFTVGIRIVV